MQPLLERIQQGEVLVADGAMGTLLLQRGLRPGECPESVNLTRPELLEDIARLYFEAGAEILEANTFGASPLKLALYGLEDEWVEINRNAVRAVRNVVGDRAYVAACCGPTGRLLLPYGDTDPDTVYAGYVKQVEVLVDAGIDGVCIETMTDLTEATLLVRAVKNVAPSLPIAATMTFDATPRGFFTIMGVSLAQAAAGLAAAGADLVGSNCGNGIVNMVRIARALRQGTDWPLIIQSNAGLPQTQEGVPVYSEGPEYLAEKAGELLDIGVSVIGGCCGTTPDHIRAIRRRVDARSQGAKPVFRTPR